jgi:DNA-binding response OmpR family regulator
MNAILISTQTEEAAVLNLLIQQVVGNVRIFRDLDAMVTSWSESPADFIMLSYTGGEAAVCDALRRIRTLTAIPVFVVMDPIDEAGLVAIYETGADLVVLRPFGVRLLVAQMRAHLRRNEGVPYFSLPTLSQRDVALDPAARSVTVGAGKPIRLTQLEFRLLFTLMTHTGQIIPSERIVDLVWGYEGDGSRDLVRGLVQRLRAKMEPDPHSPKYIMTEPGIGYYFERFDDS